MMAQPPSKVHLDSLICAYPILLPLLPVTVTVDDDD